VPLTVFALAAVVTVESLRALSGAAEPDRSPVGIALVATSVVVMPFLSWAQRRAGRELGSVSAVAVRPKSPCAGLTRYAVLRELQTLLAIWTSACHTCQRPYLHPT